MTSVTPNLDQFDLAFENNDQLTDVSVAAGMICGLALLPNTLTPSEWFDLLWCGEEPTVADSDSLGHALTLAVQIGDWARESNGQQIVELSQRYSTNLFFMGLASALNWGKSLWSEHNVEDDSDEDHLIGALMLVCVTLAWPNEDRPTDDRLPSLETARAQAPVAIDAVKKVLVSVTA